jgi:hypothetical protein
VERVAVGVGHESLTTIGTPRNGPSPGSSASALSNSGWITAFSRRHRLDALDRCLDELARDTSPARTSWARHGVEVGIHAGGSVPLRPNN